MEEQVFISDWHISHEEKNEKLPTIENEQDQSGAEEILPGVPFS